MESDGQWKQQWKRRRQSSKTVPCSASRLKVWEAEPAQPWGIHTGDEAISSSMEKIPRGGAGRKEIPQSRHVHAKPGAKKHGIVAQAPKLFAAPRRAGDLMSLASVGQPRSTKSPVNG
jgi:hypothetical protein